jgi:hypothetical protein
MAAMGSASSGQANHDGEGRPHVGGEVYGVGGEGVGAMLARDSAEGTRTGEVDRDGAEQDDEGSERGFDCEMLAGSDAVDSFCDQPDAGGKHDSGFDKGGERFDLAVAVVVVFVGWAVGDVDGEESNDGGDKVDAGVGGLGDHTE